MGSGGKFPRSRGRWIISKFHLDAAIESPIIGRKARPDGLPKRSATVEGRGVVARCTITPGADLEERFTTKTGNREISDWYMSSFICPQTPPFPTRWSRVLPEGARREVKGHHYRLPGRPSMLVKGVLRKHLPRTRDVARCNKGSWRGGERRGLQQNRRDKHGQFPMATPEMLID